MQYFSILSVCFTLLYILKNKYLLQRPQLVKGNMQLFSVDQQRSQALEAHAASFASLRVCFPSLEVMLLWWCCI